MFRDMSLQLNQILHGHLTNSTHFRFIAHLQLVRCHPVFQCLSMLRNSLRGIKVQAARLAGESPQIMPFLRVHLQQSHGPELHPALIASDYRLILIRGRVPFPIQRDIAFAQSHTILVQHCPFTLMSPQGEIESKLSPALGTNQTASRADHNGHRLTDSLDHTLMPCAHQMLVHFRWTPHKSIAETAPQSRDILSHNLMAVRLISPVSHEHLLRGRKEPTDLTLERQQSHHLLKVLQDHRICNHPATATHLHASHVTVGDEVTSQEKDP